MAQETTALPGDTFPAKTIKDLGPMLPLGLAAGDTYHKEFGVKPWRLKEERELGALRDAHNDATIFQYVGMVMATMLTHLGPHDFTQESMKFEQKRLLVGQLCMGDVFYMYIWLRIQALGPELGLNFKCPGCSKKIDNFDADLNSVEITTADNMAEASWEHHLYNPFQVRGKMVETLVIGPPRWNSLEMMPGNGFGVAKPSVIRASVMGFGTKEEAENVVITDSELDEMSKRDIETLIHEINSKAIGPNMAVEGNCPHCDFAFKMPIDWGYDNFFAVSSP